MDKSPLKIERMAINAIDALITDCCPLLVANVATNDKTPLTDGDISIYSKEEIKNENFIGKVPVQVKGKTFVNIPQPLTYTVKVNDLRHYLHSGGILYFVVAINSKHEKVIYYAALSVVKIQNTLSQLESSQKSVSIRFSKFPTDKDRIMDIVRNFYEDIRKQYSFSNTEPQPIEYWQNNPHFKGVSFNGICYGSNKPSKIEFIESVNAHDNFLYVNLDNAPIPIPASNENIKLGLFNKREEPVKVGDKVYYDNFTIIRDDREAQIQFGNAFVYTIYLKENKSSEIKYTCPSKIPQILKALSFIKAVKKERQCDIGGLLLKDFEIETTIEEIERQEKQIQNIAELLTTLHVDVDEIDYRKLSSQDFSNLNLLYRGIVNKEISKNFKVEEEFEHSIVCNIPIGDKCVQVLVIKETEGNRIEDYFGFTKDYVLALETTDGKFIPSTPYTLLTPVDFNQILNINYHNITDVYQYLYDRFPPILEDAIKTLNKVLIAFDKSKNKHLLKAAIELNAWLQEKDIENISPYAKILSNLEIAYRYRSITAEEKKSLYKVVLDATESLDKFTAYVLLGEKNEATAIFEGLCQDCQEHFKTQPIYSLYENLGKKDIDI